MRVSAILLAAALAGCGSVSGTYPRDSAIIPAASFQITETYALSLEKLVFYAGAAGLAYLVLDPLAPNWRIEEVRLAPGQYQLKLSMKRVHTGGDGEARQVFQRRADQLVREGGFAGYEILRYSEGIESGLVAQRVSEGVIRLIVAEAGPGR